MKFYCRVFFLLLITVVLVNCKNKPRAEKNFNQETSENCIQLFN